MARTKRAETAPGWSESLQSVGRSDPGGWSESLHLRARVATKCRIDTRRAPLNTRSARIDAPRARIDARRARIDTPEYTNRHSSMMHLPRLAVILRSYCWSVLKRHPFPIRHVSRSSDVARSCPT